LRHQVPTISIVGYTNAGKSTLLNALTASDVLAESRMFATLDPTTRRLRLPREREVIINDTVGFIRDLPPDLIAAFRSTLEEIDGSRLLIHLVDASNPRWQTTDSLRSIGFSRNFMSNKFRGCSCSTKLI
jgi:GTP-binding protein HflX